MLSQVHGHAKYRATKMDIALLHVYKVDCGGRKLTRSGEWKLARSREWKLSQSPEPETGFPQDEMYLRLDD